MKNEMKKILLILLSIPFITNAQDNIITEFPTKDGKVVYEEVIDSKKSKDQLFQLARKWCVDAFVDSNSAIKSQDSGTGQIIAKGAFYSRLVSGLIDQKILVTLSLQIDCKDNKYRYRFYDIVLENDYEKVSAEDKNLESNGEKKSRTVKKVIPKQITQVNTDILKLAEKLKSSLDSSSDDF